MNGDEYVRCVRCSYGGCDLRVAGCGCTLHSVGNCVFLYESFVPVLRGFSVTAPSCRCHSSAATSSVIEIPGMVLG